MAACLAHGGALAAASRHPGTPSLPFSASLQSPCTPCRRLNPPLLKPSSLHLSRKGSLARGAQQNPRRLQTRGRLQTTLSASFAASPAPLGAGSSNHSDVSVTEALAAEPCGAPCIPEAPPAALSSPLHGLQAAWPRLVKVRPALPCSCDWAPDTLILLCGETPLPLSLPLDRP